MRRVPCVPQSQARVMPPDNDRHQEAHDARRERFAPRGGAGPLVLPAITLTPRRAHVQAGAGMPLGHVPWCEHLAAAGSAREAERMAARGGYGYGEMAVRLGREPRGWEAW